MRPPVFKSAFIFCAEVVKTGLQAYLKYHPLILILDLFVLREIEGQYKMIQTTESIREFIVINNLQFTK